MLPKLKWQAQGPRSRKKSKVKTTDLNVSTAKQEIANCVLAAVYIPMELWGSFYH